MKYLVIGVVILLVLGGVWFFYKPQVSVAPIDDRSAVENSSVEDQETVDEDSVSEEYPIVSIAYDGNSYSPATVTVKTGESVTFRNKSSQNMWPASAKHPTHADYPTAGGCLGSVFDSCEGIAPEESWSFQFDLAGSWKYHDHLNPKAWGTVIVE